MKKLFFLTIALAVAAYFVGAQLVLPIFQTVPVTIAQSSAAQSAVPANIQPPVISYHPVITAAPTREALPTLAPRVTEQPVSAQPAAAVVAAQAITRSPTRTAEQALLDQFIKTVSGQGTDQVTGVYVAGRFSLPVIQQPMGNTSFVSTEDNVLTQFGSAGAYGTIGLLAHNFLSGKLFFDLHEGDNVIVVYGNGSQTEYRISQIQSYQALSPESVYSDFINLSDPNRERLSANEVFSRIYTAEDRLVFQTCIDANGDPSWGRIFVIAEKISQ